MNLKQWWEIHSDYRGTAGSAQIMPLLSELAWLPL